MLFLVFVLVLVQSALALNLTLAWTAESNQVNAFFSESVFTGDFNGDGYDDVLVGAYNYDAKGAAFVYYSSSSGISTSPVWTVESSQDYACLGWSVSSGDFNGDGYDDVLVGAHQYSNGETYEGRAYVYYGSPSGIFSTPSWTAESNQAGANFGRSVSSGDFNGDGYDDVLVGADFYSDGESGEGRAYVYYGSPSGISSTPSWTAESNLDGARFGWSVSSGDFNGDGYDDVLVGAFTLNNGQTDEGGAYVFYGGPSGISYSPSWTVESDQEGARFGDSVSSGDFNGDGYDDVLVGASYDSNGEGAEGRAYIYYGSSSGISLYPNWTTETNQNYSYLGGSVFTGDFNGDGYDDALVGAPGYDSGESNEGRAYIYFGSPSGISFLHHKTLESDYVNAFFGQAVSSGDFNGDGYDDVLVGAPRYGSGQIYEGRTYVYFSNLQLPVYSNFISFPHTTNLSAVPDLTNVTNLTLETYYGILHFPHNHSVNVDGKDLDTHIKFGDCYVSVNISGLDYTFNATAYLLMNNSDNHCGNDRIYYAPGVYDNADAIRQHDTVCVNCEKLIADKHIVKFKVYHFSSYAIGSNANLTIYDNYEGSSAQPNANITFYANYTNKSGSHISGATCTIYFDGNSNEKHNMTDNGNNYNYTFSFGSTGTHNYNITCSATNYNTLSAVDDVKVRSVVPEFSSYLGLFIFVFILVLIVVFYRSNNKK